MSDGLESYAGAAGRVGLCDGRCWAAHVGCAEGEDQSVPRVSFGTAA